MPGFETQIVNPELVRRLHGLDLFSVRIARSALLRVNLDGFIESHVSPERFVDGDDVFAYRYFSGIAPSGTMIHVRSNGDGREGRRPADDRQFAVTTGSLNDRVTYTYTDTTVDRQHTYDGRSTIDILLGEPGVGDSRQLQLVGDISSEADVLDLELQQYLDADMATQQLARVYSDGRSWTFRHGDGRSEPLRDLEMVKRQVDIAVRRGLAGAASLAEFAAPEAVSDTGHFEQKVIL